MKTLYVMVPATKVTGVLLGLAFAIDALKRERDTSKHMGVDGDAQRAEALRDELGMLYLSIAAARTRAETKLPRAGKRWSEEEDRTLRMGWGAARRAAGGSEEALRALADAVGRSPVAVALRMQLLGIWH
jgi:hypothetical protein